MQVHAITYDVAERRWSARFPAGDSPRTLVTAFGSSELANRPDVLVELARAYPRSLVVGCSTAGEIHGNVVRDGSLAVSVTRFDHTDLQLVSTEVASPEDSQGAGDELGRKLAAKPNLRAVLAFCDGLAVDGAAFSRALGIAVGSGVVVTGGLAADGFDFKRTWVTVGGALKRNACVAVGFYGPHIVIGHGTSSDWIPLSSEWVITRSEGNFIYELDYQPAIDVYRAALADRGDELPDVSVWFPLSVHTGTVTPVVRSVIGIDEAEGALVLAGEVRNGQVAKMLTADLENLIEGGAHAASAATKTGAPVSVDCLALAVSCFARRKILGLWSTEEVSSMREGLHAQRTAVTGFYGYGQISPSDGAPALHNQTLSLTVFSEARAVEPAPARPPHAVPPPIVPPTAQGYTVRASSFDARKTTWTPALPELDSARTLVLAFGAPELARNRTAFDALHAKYPSSIILGCSTAGEIHEADLRDNGMSVSVTRFARTDVRLATDTIGADGDVRGVARRIAASLGAHANLRGVLVLAPGLGVNGSELVGGINEILDGSVPVAGGLAGDGTAFGSTWVLAGKELGANRIAAIGFYGSHVVLGHGARGGWDRFGLKRTITRSEGNVLYELDNRPALQIYKEYLGERAAQLPASGLSLPLAVRDPVTEHQSVRTLVGIDEKRSSLIFAGDVPTGHIAQFMKADVERLINGATHAALMANESGPPASADSLVLAISCVGRRHMLGAHTEEEIEAIVDAFRSERARVTGFYAYGELSPTGANGLCELHNQAMTLLVVSESVTPVIRGEGRRPSAQIAAPVAPPSEPPMLVETQPMMPSTAMLAGAPVIPLPPPPIPLELAPTGIAAPIEPDEPRGPIVRIPRAEVSEITMDEVVRDAIRIVTIRGRITEAFKGETAAAMLRGRVILDLSDVHRVTSFGVREWLAMFGSAKDLSECYLARCSESTVNQLTMIRAFDGGAKLLSFFAPYLCQACNKPFERLFDVELDAQEIASVSPEQVRCPRCDGAGKFDDDPRSYFAFPGAHARTRVPDDVRAVHAAMCAQDQVRAAEDIETLIEGDIARVRVIGRLSLNIRWRRVFENVDGFLTVDLSSVTAVEASGLQSLDFHLRTATCRKPIVVEHATVGLVERFVQRPAPEIELRTIVVSAFCTSCNVARTAPIRIADMLDGRRPTALCKRCDHRLELSIDSVIDQYVALLRAKRDEPPPRPSLLLPIPAAPPPPPEVVVALPPAPPPPARRKSAIGAAVGAGVIAVGAIAWFVVGATKKAPAKPMEIVQIVDAGVTTTPQRSVLPPGWADRAVTNDRDHVYIVGKSTQVSVDAAISDARADATLHLIGQLYTDLGSVADPAVFAFLKTKVDGKAAGEAARATFEQQYGKLASFQRDDLAEVGDGAARVVYVRFKIPRKAYQNMIAAYADTEPYLDGVVALWFPLLSELAPPDGNLVVIAGSNAGTAIPDLPSMAALRAKKRGGR